MRAMSAFETFLIKNSFQILNCEALRAPLRFARSFLHERFCGTPHRKLHKDYNTNPLNHSSTGYRPQLSGA